MTLRHICAALVAVSLLAVFATTTSADPLVGEQLKFLQLPLNSGQPTFLTPGQVFAGGAPFPGHDEVSTAYLDTSGHYRGNFMADDFSDTRSTDIVHVQWWGSYPNQPVPAATTAQKFLIAFESDVAAQPGSFSHPGSPYSAQVVTFTNGPLGAGSGNFTEKLVSPAGIAEPVFQYNAELSIPVHEQAGVVQWIKIVALDDFHQPGTTGALNWGWHDRDWSIKNLLAAGPPVPSPGERDLNSPVVLTTVGPVWHFQDDAVSGLLDWDPSLPPQSGLSQFSFQPQNYLDPNAAIGPIDGPVGIGQFSKDLAFALYTTPEPSSAVLMGLGFLFMARLVWKRRRTA